MTGIDEYANVPQGRQWGAEWKVDPAAPSHTMNFRHLLKAFQEASTKFAEQMMLGSHVTGGYVVPPQFVREIRRIEAMHRRRDRKRQR